ncbi:MAG: hypothetical protein IIA06_08790 [Proteobacteria bacterium]|nr:hypothetical protein [Pseudomonadota bacterium]
MELAELIHSLYKQGLGEHLILHLIKGKVILSNITYKNGRLAFNNENYLSDFLPDQLKPCWENGTLGLISNSIGHEWEGLTFYGLEHCQLAPDLSSTRNGAMIAAENQYGDKLIDFVGSVYRGFQLMLDNHFLPVVLFKPIKTTSGETGLIVTDLRMIPMAISLIQTIHDVVRKSTEDNMTIGIDNANLNTTEFERMFGDFMSKD